MAFATLKARLREFGWRDYPSDRLTRSWVHRQSEHRPEATLAALNLPPSEQATAVRNEIIDNDPYRFTEYLIRLPEPVWVEPLHGMVVAPGRRLVRELLDVHRGVTVLPPHQFEFRRSLRNAPVIKEAILLRHHYGEENYFHFYADVLPKFALLAREPALAGLPLIVSRRQYATSYFQGMIRRAGLEGRTWLAQDDRSIRVERLWCAKGQNCTRGWIEEIWNLLRIPTPPLGASRRVFLKRRRPERRPLQNQDELEHYFSTLGFEIIDTAPLSLDAQIELFGSIRFLVAEHGAGCSNILHRRGAPLGFLELFPPGYISTAYFLISHLLGYDYRILRGVSAPGGEGGYRIPLATLEAQVEALLHA